MVAGAPPSRSASSALDTAFLDMSRMNEAMKGRSPSAAVHDGARWGPSDQGRANT